LLPGDEDELLAGLMDDFDLSGFTDEDDFFGSGGGMEIEFESRDHPHFGSIPHFGFSNGVSGEHPLGERPSRTLFVRNINSNVEDSELRSLFEQYGDIRSLYTACKHRGFVMISYYDIRAARAAMLSLQNKPLRRRKLDIHFSIPKDNPSEKDINQGTLVVFNLDPSVSDDDLLQIFGIYGEVKEMRDLPHKKHHKFIEFFDVRGAEAALKSLNRIKLELSRHGNLRRSLMQQIGRDQQDQEEARVFRHQVSYPIIANSPPGNLLQSQPLRYSLFFSSCSWRSADDSSVGTNNLAGLASILSTNASSPVKISPIGKHFSVPNMKLSSSPGPVSSSFCDSKSSCFGTLTGPEFLWGSPAVQSEQGWGFATRPLERHFGFLPESPETSSSYIGFRGNYPESSWPGLQMPRTGPAHQLEWDRSRSRRVFDTGIQIDEDKKRYQLEFEKIVNGEDSRTTLMIKNIPNKYTWKMLVTAIDETHKGTYDFLYLPIDFKNKCNVGYAFINMISPSHIVSLYEAFHGKKWEKFNSEKVASLAYARIQGRAALVSHFQNSSLMNLDRRCRPVIFQSD
ncbi:hypothetical protein M569_10829, partial [Genlisea aurea]